jgi:DNA-binding transcriptional MerR regulator
MQGIWFSQVEVSRAFRVTPRQLQWWNSEEIVCPLRVKRGPSGRAALCYSEAAALAVGILGHLRDSGVSLFLLRRMTDGLLEQLREGKRFDYLVYSPEETWLLDSPDEVIRAVDWLTSKHRQGCLVVDVAELARKLRVQ